MRRQRLSPLTSLTHFLSAFLAHFLVPWPDAAWTGSGGARPDENSAKKAIAFDRADAFFKRLFLLPGPDAAWTWTGGAKGRTKSTLPDEKAAKKGIAFDDANAIYVVQQVKRGIAFDGTNAISFLMVLVHF